MTGMMVRPMAYEMQNVQQIRDKIKQVFDWNCPMNDAMILKRYTMSSDGDLVMIVR